VFKRFIENEGDATLTGQRIKKNKKEGIEGEQARAKDVKISNGGNGV
jgi:hypothetical protein